MVEYSSPSGFHKIHQARTDSLRETPAKHLGLPCKRQQPSLVAKEVIRRLFCMLEVNFNHVLKPLISTEIRKAVQNKAEYTEEDDQIWPASLRLQGWRKASMKPNYTQPLFPLATSKTSTYHWITPLASTGALHLSSLKTEMTLLLQQTTCITQSCTSSSSPSFSISPECGTCHFIAVSLSSFPVGIISSA